MYTHELICLSYPYGLKKENFLIQKARLNRNRGQCLSHSYLILKCTSPLITLNTNYTYFAEADLLVCGPLTSLAFRTYSSFSLSMFYKACDTVQLSIVKPNRFFFFFVSHMLGKILKSISCNWEDEGYIVKATSRKLPMFFLHLSCIRKNPVIQTALFLPCEEHPFK